MRECCEIKRQDSYHNNYTNEQVCKDEVTQENKDDSEPLAVWSCVQVFLNLCPAIHLKRTKISFH